MVDAKKEDVVEKCMKLLGRSAEEQLIINTTSLFAHDYYMWKTLKEEVGEEKAKELYGQVWLEIGKLGFENTKKAMGVNKILDISTLGRILQKSLLGTYEIVEETEDRHVGHLTFCANPVYTPLTPYAEKLEFYKVVAEITKDYIHQLVKLSGLEGKYYGTADKFMCLGDDACRFIIEKRSKREGNKNVKA